MYIITPPQFLLRFFTSMFKYPGKGNLEVSSSSSKRVSVRHLTLGSDSSPYIKDYIFINLLLIERIFKCKTDFIWVS